MSALLEISALACGYDGKAVIADVSFAMSAGEILAVIGPNGSGKSTLLHAIGRLLHPMRGQIRLRERSIWELAPRAHARAVALAPQRTAEMAWPVTVEEFITLGRAPHRGWLMPFTPADRESVRRAMSRLNVGFLAARNAASLSGGEMRRVMLARAFAQEPQVLLLDEPAAYLDIHYQAELLGLVRDLAKERGMAVILTVHDFTLAALCADRMALLHDGRLRAVGQPREVLSDAVLKPVYGEKIEVFDHPRSGKPVVLPKLEPRPAPK